MKKKIIDKLIHFIIKNKNSSEKDIKIYRYGLEALFNLIVKTSVVLIICLTIGTIKECLLLILFYFFLRLFAFGLHASNSIGCWLTTIPVYIGGSLFTKYIIISKYISIIIWFIYTLFAILWAPADTKKRPLIHAEQRKKLKLKSLLVFFSFCLILLLVNNQSIQNAIAFCMALEGICICPLTYLITGNKFNNYIYYNQSHGLN